MTDRDHSTATDVMTRGVTPAEQASASSEGTPSPSLVAFASSALIVLSVVLTSLSIGGVAEILPSSARIAIVCVVALTLPGLPIAALLRLPSNGVFASVAIAISLSTTILLAQLDIALGLHQTYLIQFAILGIAAIACAQLVRRGAAHTSFGTTSRALVTAGTRLVSTLVRQPSAALTAAAVVLFATAVLRLHTAAAGRYGLLEALGVDYFVGLALLGVVLTVEYRRRTIDRTMLAVSNVTLVGYLTLPVALADGTAPFVTAYVHRYLANMIAVTGTLPPPVDARASWAGFFSGTAHLTTIGGLGDSGAFLLGASFAFGVLIMFPVFAVGLAIGRDRKIAWLGVTIFTLFNWYQQDYFAPQAVAMQLYATILAVLLWQLRASTLPPLDGAHRRRGRWSIAWTRLPDHVTGRDARWTMAVELVLLVIIAAMVVSHQLTPGVTIVALAVFSAFGLTRYKLLWVAAVIMFVSWFTYGADAFWQGHLGEILSDVGGFDSNLSSGVTARISGDPIYSDMQYLRIAASVLLIGTAFVGWLRLPRDRAWPLIAVLAVVPFGVVLVQSYGGEVVIRCLLYASPLLAPLAASVLLRLIHLPATTPRRRWGACIATASLFFALAVLLMTNRGLNTSFEHTTREELAVAKQLESQVGSNDVTSWGQGSLYGVPLPLEVEPTCFGSGADLAECTAQRNTPYVIDTTQDEKYREYRFSVPRSVFVDAVDTMVAEKGFEIMYRGDGVTLLKRTDAPRLDVGPGR